jgi:hypothetical protein
MADEEADVLVLNDLPIPENRDLAWKMLRERGDSVQLDSDLALTAQRTIECRTWRVRLRRGHRGDLPGAGLPRLLRAAG